MLGRIKSYCFGLKERLSNATSPDKGMIAGGLTGSIYSAIRAALTPPAPLNLPLTGNMLLATASTRFIFGALLGGFAGSTMGNRYGQIYDKFVQTTDSIEENENAKLDNQTFMMRTMPFVFAIAANAVIICYPVPGGNPIFGILSVLSTTELHTLTTLNGLFVGGTIGHRGGKFIDYFTNQTLIADFGLTRVYGFFAKAIDKQHQNNGKIKLSCTTAIEKAIA